VDKIRGGTRPRGAGRPMVRGPRTQTDAGRRTGVYARLEACPVGHDRGVNGQNGRPGLGRRVGVELGLIRPSHGPRSQLARVLTVEADSSHGELIAGLVWSTLTFVLVASNVFRDMLWLRLISVVALVLLVNPIRAVRLLLQRHRADRERPPTR